MADSGYYSINDFPGDGSQTTFEVSFAGGYISRSHISARLFRDSDKTFADVLFDWVNSYTVRVGAPVPIGYTLRVYRKTPIEQPLVDYSDGALLSEVNLDTANKQAIFAAAEAADAFGTVPGNDALRDATAALVFARSRSNHTGTQAMSTVDGLVAGLAGKASAIALADGSADIGYKQGATGSVLRPMSGKLGERLSVLDFVSVVGGDIGIPLGKALAAITLTGAARLIIPRGAWIWTSNLDISAYSKVTLVIEAGVTINQGTNNIVLPDRVEGSAKFSGSGTISQRNASEAVLVSPPGGYVRYGNDARGVLALGNNIGGHNNLAWGFNALGANQYSRSNIAFGNGTLAKMIGDPTGARAMVNGSEILSYFASGDACVALGDFVLRDNLRGTECIGIGANSLQQQTDGHCNIAIGANSQITGINTGYNISVGGYCLVVNQSKNNIAIGWAALEGQTTGSNIAIGHAAMNGNKTGSRNVGIGPLVMATAQASTDCVVIGQETFRNALGGTSCVLIGAYAGGSITTSVVNLVAIGYYAAVSAKGANNTAVGTNALSALVDGDGNTALGSGAGNAINGLSNTIAIGLSAAPTKSGQAVIGGAYTGETVVNGVLVMKASYTVAGLPSAASVGIGARSFATDANATTFAAAVAGGGTNKVPVYSDGAIWRIG